MEENAKATICVDVPRVLKVIIVKLEDVHLNVPLVREHAETERANLTTPAYVSQAGLVNYATRINLGPEYKNKQTKNNDFNYDNGFDRLVSFCKNYYGILSLEKRKEKKMKMKQR